MHNKNSIETIASPLDERGLERRRTNFESTSKYMTIRFDVPTYNMGERLLSKAGFALNDCRKRIIPLNFEKQVLFIQTLVFRV